MCCVIKGFNILRKIEGNWSFFFYDDVQTLRQKRSSCSHWKEIDNFVSPGNVFLVSATLSSETRRRREINIVLWEFFLRSTRLTENRAAWSPQVQLWNTLYRPTQTKSTTVQIWTSQSSSTTSRREAGSMWTVWRMIGTSTGQVRGELFMS